MQAAHPEIVAAMATRQAQDFVTASPPAHQTFFSHFVVDGRIEVIAFEERGSLIRRRSFVAAFEGLLDEADFEAGGKFRQIPLPSGSGLRPWTE